VLTEGWVDYLTGPFGIVFAFAAGVISFLSPCVLPLVPAYLAHLTGVASDPGATASRRETMSHATAFVTGFGLVFTAIGASAGLVGGLVVDHMPTLEKVAGVFLIILGLNLMGVIRIPWLYRTFTVGSGTSGGGSSGGGTLAYAGAGAGGGTTTVVTVKASALSYARSFGFGGSFAIAWTPCIGPVLGAIILLASQSGTVYQGAYLLLAYSAGLAVPFLIAGFAVGSVYGMLRKYGRFMPVLEVTAGAIVVLVGMLIFLNEFTSLNQYFDLIPGLNAV
jgi:cytochrome c-type biogenesis protein